MEVSAIKHMGAAGVHGRSPLLRLQSDERLVALVRRGNQHAFEALVARYQSRLLSFCRHMLSSREDAEDVLQEVFAAAFHAMVADERPINVRPWLYRIARNRSLNHLRRAQAVGVDSMDVHFSEGGISTADKVHRREDFRLLVTDVQDLPETQRTALLLREIDALSYEQIAEAMDNTVPSVKSLLVRARVALAEAAEARALDCEAVRFELAEVAEGLKRTSSPVRRHLRSCERCSSFKRQLASTNRALAALMPAGPLLLLKKSLMAHLGTAAAASGGAAAAVGSGGTAGGILHLGVHTAASKAAAGLAAAAIVTAGAVEVRHVAVERKNAAVAVATSSPDQTSVPPTRERPPRGDAGPLGVGPLATAETGEENGRLGARAAARREDEKRVTDSAGAVLAGVDEGVLEERAGTEGEEDKPGDVDAPPAGADALAVSGVGVSAPLSGKAGEQVESGLPLASPALPLLGIQIGAAVPSLPVPGAGSDAQPGAPPILPVPAPVTETPQVATEPAPEPQAATEPADPTPAPTAEGSSHAGGGHDVAPEPQPAEPAPGPEQSLQGTGDPEAEQPQPAEPASEPASPASEPSAPEGDGGASGDDEAGPDSQPN